MNYTYIVTQVEPDNLQEELCSLGSEGWELITVVPLSRLDGMALNGQPKIKITYQLIFKSEMI